MSDRTSADVFGQIFTLLASNKSKGEIAKALWKSSFNFDFSQCQMEADRALIKLGFARKVDVEEDVTYTDGTTGVEKYKETQYRSQDLHGWDE